MSLFFTFKLSSQHERRGIFIILSVLFCVCVAVRVHAHVDEFIEQAGMFLCALMCGCELHKISVSQKVAHSFSCFQVSWKVRKISFPTKNFCNKGGAARKVSSSGESVQVSGTNTIFHLVLEQAFELTLYVAWLRIRLADIGLICWRVGSDSPWEERDDTINYISKKPAEGVKKCFCERSAQSLLCSSQHHMQQFLIISTMDSTLLTALWLRTFVSFFTNLPT